MTHSRCEPTIDEIMGDPMVKALMKADRVDADQLENRLRRFGRRLEPVSRRSEEGEGLRPMRRFAPPAAAFGEARCC